MSTRIGEVGISIGLDGEFICDGHYLAYRTEGEKREREIELGKALVAGKPLSPRPKWYAKVGNHGGGGPCAPRNPSE